MFAYIKAVLIFEDILILYPATILDFCLTSFGSFSLDYLGFSGLGKKSLCRL